MHLVGQSNPPLRAPVRRRLPYPYSDLHVPSMVASPRYEKGISAEVGPPYGPGHWTGLIWAVLGSSVLATGANLGELDGEGG